MLSGAVRTKGLLHMEISKLSTINLCRELQSRKITIYYLNYHLFCVVLLGNKADLQDSRVVDSNEARNVAENLGLRYFETSAATGQNVNESVEALLDQVSHYLI